MFIHILNIKAILKLLTLKIYKLVFIYTILVHIYYKILIDGD